LLNRIKIEKAKIILVAIFVFILPLTLFLSLLSHAVSYEVEYICQGKKYFSQYVTGFPFFENGGFEGMNGQFTSFETTSNYLNFFLNKLIYLTISFLIYFLFFRKISFQSKTRTILLTIIVTFIYSRILKHHVFEWTCMTNYQYGLWPDSITAIKCEWDWNMI
jgi:hypothetical protein